MPLTPEELEHARQLEEEDRLRFRREAHKNGRWDEAHFGVGNRSAGKPAPKPSLAWPVVKWAAAVGVLGCAGLFAADWLGAIDVGIRATLRPDTATTALAHQQELAAAALEQDLGDSPYGVPSAGAVSAPADSHAEAAPASEEPLAVLASHSPSAQPRAAMSPTSTAGKRGIDHLARQRTAAVAEVERFLVILARAEKPGRDGLTYEQRLIRDRQAAHGRGGNASARVRLDLAWDTYLAGKNEHAARLAHAREVLASIDRRLGELNASVR